MVQPLFYFDEADFVNDQAVIRQNPNHVSINSCLEIDLTGQICSDSLGTRMYSGVGGQLDFIRGAALSEGGMPVITLPSITSKVCSHYHTTHTRQEKDAKEESCADAIEFCPSLSRDFMPIQAILSCVFCFPPSG